jgi:serine/threonine-protein kinase
MMAGAAPLRRVDRYVLEEPLGHGGFGTVYRARHVHTGQGVALKVAQDSDEPTLRRLVREAQILATVRHPNVVQVFDAGIAEGVAFVAMELVAGESLDARLTRERALPLATAMRLMLQLLAGLGAAHAAGVVHRDIKPANLVVLGDGTLKIVDFGISRSSAVAASAASVGHWQGTPGYMAPEQFEAGIVDARADLYSAAVVLFCMLAGERPFPENDVARLLVRMLRERAPSLASRAPHVPASVVSAVDRALTRDPDARFRSAAEFAAALESPFGASQSPPADATRGAAGSYPAGAVMLPSTPQATPFYGGPPLPSAPAPTTQRAARRPWIWVLVLLGGTSAVGGLAVVAVLQPSIRAAAGAGPEEAAEKNVAPVPVAPSAAPSVVKDPGAVPKALATGAPRGAKPGPSTLPPAPPASSVPSNVRASCTCMGNEPEHQPLCQQATAPTCRCNKEGSGGATALCATPWVRDKSDNLVCPAGDPWGYRSLPGAATGGACGGYDNASDKDSNPVSPRYGGTYECRHCGRKDDYAGKDGDVCRGINASTGAAMTGVLARCR